MEAAKAQLQQARANVISADASIGKIKPLFTESHPPASAHCLPPYSRWYPRSGAARTPPSAGTNGSSEWWKRPLNFPILAGVLFILVLPSTSCCLLPRWEEHLPPEARSGEMRD